MEKGYYTSSCYYGHIGNEKYMPFASESDYKEYLEARGLI